MVKNIIFDVGGVWAREVNGSALAHLDVAEQRRISDLVYYKSSGFIEVLLGNLSTADYAAKLIVKYPHLEKEISFLLDPDNLPVTYPIDRQVLDFIYDLHETYKIYFLSDMIDMSYNYLKDILQDFDGGAYSFQEHLKKPNPAFFEVLLKRYNINPVETVFFDDREKNVAAAQKLNMQAVVFTGVDSIINTIKA